MGFTTWSFGPRLQDVNATYSFIQNNADVYVEHLDNSIPWNAWINDLPLPIEFTNEIQGKASRKPPNTTFALSVGLLNLNRDNLATDLDGSLPTYTRLNDSDITMAYTKHVAYLVDQFAPDYLTIAIEVNELWLQNNSLWQGYTLLIDQVIADTKIAYPELKISVSISLHNLYQATLPNAEAYNQVILDHINQMDFVAISYYPFLKNQSAVTDFQETLDFLHNNTNKPIAFVESGHIAEDLVVPNLNVSIAGDPGQQNSFLEILLGNAQVQNYEFVIWWAHRDYDALWETFPTELRDLGQLWRDTGLLDENGAERLSYTTWQSYFNDNQ
ncbi:MAG: hypothetical protein ED555_06650 [Allomuricauda sp.]|nr:MAG: hypothetical protein ED555_06650 [Allomuricauda sp.]